MDTLDLTEGLCGWNSDQYQNDEESSMLSHEMELKNMFNELKIVNSPKKSYQKKQRPKSSSLINIKRRQQVQNNTAKTARILPKKSNHKSIHIPATHRASSDTNPSRKSTKESVINAYLPSTSSRKKLQRSYSNLYIRDTAKLHANDESNQHKARQLNIQLNLDNITTLQSHIKTDAECIPFSEALYRSKYPETANNNSNTKKVSKSQKHRKSKTKCKQRTELRSKPNKVLMTVNDFYTQHQLKHTPFLTPSSSMMSLCGKHKGNLLKQKNPNINIKNINNINMTKRIAPYKKPKTSRRSSRNKDTKSTAIPIKCFNSTVCMKHEPKINTHRPLRMGMEQRQKNQNVRSRSVDFQDNGYSAQDIERFHHEMNMKHVRVVHPKYNDDDDKNMSLENKIKHMIARWESQEKIKTRKSHRMQRFRPFK